MKQDTLGGYLNGDLELPQKALLTAWDCLDRFHGEMVLVGGLAIRHITRPPEVGMPGPVTLDIDFGISIGASSGLYDSIRVTLSRHGFRWEGGRFKRDPKGEPSRWMMDCRSALPQASTGRSYAIAFWKSKA
jgi:hypothetical protein